MVAMHLYVSLSHVVLLQNFADPGIRNTEGKTPQDLADPQAKLVLSGKGGVASLQHKLT